MGARQGTGESQIARAGQLDKAVHAQPARPNSVGKLQSFAEHAIFHRTAMWPGAVTGEGDLSLGGTDLGIEE